MKGLALLRLLFLRTHQVDGSRDVGGLEVELPEAVGFPAGDIADVDSRGAKAPDPAAFQPDLFEKADIVPGCPAGTEAGESCGKHGGLQSAMALHMYGAPVAVGPFAGLRVV